MRAQALSVQSSGVMSKVLCRHVYHVLGLQQHAARPGMSFLPVSRLAASCDVKVMAGLCHLLQQGSSPAQEGVRVYKFTAEYVMTVLLS